MKKKRLVAFVFLFDAEHAHTAQKLNIESHSSELVVKNNKNKKRGVNSRQARERIPATATITCP